MLTGNIFQISLMLTTLLTTLVTGFILLFAIVVMPGFGTLNNAEFLRAFQVIDRIIQNNQPLFIFIWAGSALSLIIATLLGFTQLDGIARVLLILAALCFLLGTQVPTVTVNIPLNNRVQTLDIATLDEATLQTERQAFEPRWNRWNVIRTIFASVASVLLIIVVRLL